MLYRFARGVAETFPFACFVAFVGAFFVALAFTVIYPILPLFLLFVSIFALVFCVATARLLRWVEHTFARRALRQDRCPACALPLEHYRLLDEELHECVACQRVFRTDGETWEPDPDAPTDAQREPLDFDRRTLAH